MNIQTLLIDAVALIVGIVIHESAHALAAYVLGDKTARSRGRVSLNPTSIPLVPSSCRCLCLPPEDLFSHLQSLFPFI